MTGRCGNRRASSPRLAISTSTGNIDSTASVSSGSRSSAIAEARGPARLEVLTLTVTDGNGSALRLYERYGFIAYGTLQKAIKVGDRYHAKVHMALHL